MQSELHQNMQAALLGQRGGYKRAERLTAEQRSAISRHAARVRWHPQEVQVAKEKAQELAPTSRVDVRTPYLQPDRD